MKMPECKECQKEINGYLEIFNCKYCGEVYCAVHRLPEDHHCNLEGYKPPFNEPMIVPKVIEVKADKPLIPVFEKKECIKIITKMDKIKSFFKSIW